MPSELERLASQLRFLAEQVRQHRGPLVHAAQKLADAAGAVRHLEAEYDDGRTAVVPAEVAGQLSDAARSTKNVVGPLGETAELLNVFASRLATAMSGAPTGDGPKSEGYEPAGSSTDSAAPESEASAIRTDPDRQPGYPTPASPPAPRQPGPVSPTRYGRYPTTTVASVAPRNRSYEVDTQSR